MKNDNNQTNVVNDQTNKVPQQKQAVVNDEKPIKNTEVKTTNNQKVVSNNDKVVEENVQLPQKKDGQAASVSAATTNQVVQNNAQTIGTIKPDKQKSPIAMLVLFSSLVFFILFMPTAIDLFNKYFGTNIKLDPGLNVQEEEKKKPEPSQTVNTYPLSESTVIAVDKVEFTNFKKDNTDGYYLTFNLKNNGSTMYSFEKKLYLDYYDNNNTLVGRSYLDKIKEVSGGLNLDYKVVINNSIYTNATKVELVQRTNDDYPVITLVNGQLTCTNETNSLIYKFDGNERLTNIRDTETYIKGDDDFKFASDKIDYSSRISILNAIDGVTAILTDTDTGFITVVDIDYKSADYSKLSTNNNYYVKDTYARIISFEMNAKGYNCS